MAIHIQNKRNENFTSVTSKKEVAAEAPKAEAAPKSATGYSESVTPKAPQMPQGNSAQPFSLEQFVARHVEPQNFGYIDGQRVDMMEAGVEQCHQDLHAENEIDPSLIQLEKKDPETYDHMCWRLVADLLQAKGGISDEVHASLSGTNANRREGPRYV